MKNDFRCFLLTEEKAYLGQRVGDVLNALQELNDHAWRCCHAGCQSTFRLESKLSNAIMVQTDKAFLLELATTGV
jgi:hypothetical protein